MRRQVVGLVSAVVIMLIVSLTTLAAWGQYSPTPFPTPQWAQNVLRDQVAARIDAVVGTQFHFFEQSQDPNQIVIHANGNGASYTAFVTIQQQAAGYEAWQGNFTQVTGYVTSNRGYFYVFGMKAPNKPLDVSVMPMQMQRNPNSGFGTPAPPPFLIN